MTELELLRQDLAKEKKKVAILEKMVEDTTRRLYLSNQELEAFCYSVSHDLRAPLRAINGFATTLKLSQPGKRSAEEMEFLTIISEEAVRMGELIDGLLAFSRLGRKKIQKSEVDMNLLAQLAVDEVLRSKQARNPANIEILPLPPAKCDQTLIRQTYVNLLSNALKFSRTKPKPQIEIGHTLLEGKPYYYVKDNGIGFDNELRDKLFEVFERLHHPDEFEGTGIGLALVKRIITRHGGEIIGNGLVNEGATFYFYLPNE
jgi:light-regulated signal transduction histidine kinase (bacteriophytochrome)